MFKADQIAVIICTEGGQLEHKSRLFVQSLRTFGGGLRDIEIYSIQPRQGEPVSQETLAFFERWNVHHEVVPLNTAYPDYGLANKVFACAHYEDKLPHDYLLFMDSDQIVFNDLDDLCEMGDHDLAIRVVALKGVGTDGKDENTEYWKSLYEICGVQYPNTNVIITGVDQQKIFPYYNSGLILARRRFGLFNQWKDDFRKVMSVGITPEHGQFFVEQSTLSATISRISPKTRELPLPYNYPALRHLDLKTTDRWLGLDAIKTFHYHRLFKPPRRVNAQALFPNFKGEKLKWMENTMVSSGVNPRPFFEQWELDLLKNKAQISEIFKNQMR